jgi:hypothetical protein
MREADHLLAEAQRTNDFRIGNPQYAMAGFGWMTGKTGR